MEAINEKDVLFVDAAEWLERLCRGHRKARVRAENVSWEQLPARVRAGALPSVAVLNLTAPGALSLREAARLPQEHPGLRMLYVLDTQRPPRASRALSDPGADFISSRADPGELASRLQRLLDMPPSPRPTPSVARRRPGPAPSLGLLPEVHHAVTGRLDARRMAHWLNMPLKTLARALGREYATIHKTPDASALQESLRVYLRAVSALSYLLGSREAARIWLHTPNPDLEGETPQAMLERGLPEAETVAVLLEDSLHGMPG